MIRAGGLRPLLNRMLGGRGAKEGQAGGADPTRPWTAPVRPTRVRRHAEVDTAKVLAFPMLFTRLSGIARQGRKATQGEAGNMKKSRSKGAESPSELIGGRPRSGRGVEVERDSSLVAQRADLHR